MTRGHIQGRKAGVPPHSKIRSAVLMRAGPVDRNMAKSIILVSCASRAFGAVCGGPVAPEFADGVPESS
jgi:hypothetical protein